MIQPRGARTLHALIALTLLFSLGNAIYSLTTYLWPTGDERFHYTYSELYWKEGKTRREDVHNFNSTVPLTVLNVLADNLYTELIQHRDYRYAARRAPQVFWYIFMLCGAYSLCRSIGDRRVACWATLLLALEPNLNSHASLIGSDLQFCAFIPWFFLALAALLRTPAYRLAAMLGIVHGLSFCAKYSGTFLCLPAALGFVYLVCSPRGTPFARHLMRCGGFAALYLLCMFTVINLAYSFIGTFSPLASYDWNSEVLRSAAQQLPDFPLLLPIPFITGFELQLHVEQTWQTNTIILGRQYPSGVWFYFPLSWLLKTPLALIALAIVTVVLYLQKVLRQLNMGVHGINVPWTIMAITWIVLMLYFNCFFRTQVGLRYSYPCIVLFYLLLAYALPKVWKVSIQTVLAVALCILVLAETFPYRGNLLSFTNSLITEKKLSYRYFSDSNIDWGQNIATARDELSNRGVVYHFIPPHILPGINAIPHAALVGVWKNFEQYKWLRENIEPSYHVKHNLLVFDISEEDFAKFLSEDRSFHPNSRQSCDKLNIATLDIPALPGTSSLTIPANGAFCLEVPARAAVRMTAKDERVIDRMENPCQWSRNKSKYPIWFELLPGTHRFCTSGAGTTSVEITVLAPLKASQRDAS